LLCYFFQFFIPKIFEIFRALCCRSEFFRGKALASQGVITLEIGIHGIPVNLPNEAYTIGGGPLLNYHDKGLDYKENYYYKRVYIGCKRAVDFIFSLPEFDGTNIVTFGGSQGGALSLVTTAIDPRIKGAVCFYPALCDMEGYTHGRAGGWPHMFKKPQYCHPKAIETIRYYDVANFVTDIKVPVFMSFGYNDTTCPPTTSYSVMNKMTCPITPFIVPDSYHFMYPEQREAAVSWALNLLHE
jgi:cephalosporin-C deacetylase